MRAIAAVASRYRRVVRHVTATTNVSDKARRLRVCVCVFLVCVHLLDLYPVLITIPPMVVWVRLHWTGVCLTASYLTANAGFVVL